MATNPNRPQYQDTIESAWGQTVADHVIRRYATTAERDADLAAITSADLEGQVISIAPVGGPSYLMYRRSGLWLDIPDMQGGRVGLSTDSASNIRVNFPRAFAGQPQVFNLMVMDYSSTVWGHLRLLEQFLSATGASVEVRDWNGGLMGTGKGGSISWFAAYWPNRPGTGLLRDAGEPVADDGEPGTITPVPGEPEAKGGDDA